VGVRKNTLFYYSNLYFGWWKVNIEEILQKNHYLLEKSQKSSYNLNKVSKNKNVQGMQKWYAK